MLQERRGSDLRGMLSNAKTRETARPPVGAICRPVILCLCLLAAVYPAQPGFAETAENPPATTPIAPTPPGGTEAPGPAAPLASPYFPPTLILPQITPLTSPAVISPQFQLDYNLQIPLFGELPLRKELSEEGIDFIARYISQTASNTAGVHGTGTASSGTGSRTDPNGVVFLTGELIAPQGARNKVDFQLGVVDGLYRVQDITIDNVSMVVSYRSEIQAVLASHGRQFGALLTAMREER
jgi:hypothetical protein